jgi:hypothetical protein
MKDKKGDTTHVYFNNISSLQIMQAIILASKKRVLNLLTIGNSKPQKHPKSTNSLLLAKL